MNRLCQMEEVGTELQGLTCDYSKENTIDDYRSHFGPDNLLPTDYLASDHYTNRDQLDNLRARGIHDASSTDRASHLRRPHTTIS